MVLWDGLKNGEILVKPSYDFYRSKQTAVQGKKNMWQAFLPPKISMFAWKICYHRITTNDVLCRWAKIPSPVYINCIRGTKEYASHLFIRCDIAKKLLAVDITGLTGRIISFFNALQLIQQACMQNLKYTVGKLRLSCILYGLWV